MKSIKSYLFIIFFISAFVSTSCAQQKASPPATATGNIDGVEITIEYHQPSVRGRKIMNGLVPFDKVWRTGANNATTIEFSENVKIDGKALPAGKYSLFSIPTDKEWTIIFNKTADQWGSYNYQEKDDALRVKVTPTKVEMVETFEFNVLESAVEFKWENTAVKFRVEK